MTPNEDNYDLIQDDSPVAIGIWALVNSPIILMTYAAGIGFQVSKKVAELCER